ncbi:helix-turn-helix domain-containing protein [Halalkalicoccus jeotgali]|uniref:DNA binding domain-containing protein n=1 Tax=Halalkalicoccus jeotgali (strain DSM 18796 / CECT 7217 / JCM 14584 / KCTC 4019 / B3) TaxID=795797 RepID=D8J7H4_HALJB|nr:bacterio-opsin activator domain-containing protein [Halalkalicoccus jeotgali]ADJ14069.1 DNA binding domain-containing protein [Halalkalicoccus jeotgali B3]ELY33887.1 DNA binding domain-containing protein [Halalkalicoccus jeotgali B3]
MATIAEIRVPTEGFALSHTLDALDEVNFEIERIVAHDPDHVMPYVWATGADPETLRETLEEDPSVSDVEIIAEPDEESLYRMNWIDSTEALVHILTEEDGTVLAAEGRQDGWFLRILFPDRDALSRTYEFCEDEDLSMDVQRIYNIDQGKQGRFGLTDEQEETIASAYEHGYYDVPRDVSLSDFAEELDISHQALSERLRRGHKTLVENTVIVGRDGEK